MCMTRISVDGWAVVHRCACLQQMIIMYSHEPSEISTSSGKASTFRKDFKNHMLSPRQIWNRSMVGSRPWRSRKRSDASLLLMWSMVGWLFGWLIIWHPWPPGMVLISRTDIAFSVFLIWILWDVRVSACLDLRSLNFRNGAFPHLRFAHVGNYFVEFGFIFCIFTYSWSCRRECPESRTCKLRKLRCRFFTNADSLVFVVVDKKTSDHYETNVHEKSEKKQQKISTHYASKTGGEAGKFRHIARRTRNP